MPGQFLAAMVLVIVAGALEGLFSLPVTRTPRWQFENIWGAGSLVALVLIPWPLAVCTVPHLGDVYRSAGAGTVLLTLAFGVGWGVGGIFWGRAIAAVGMALGVSLLMGLINVFGSIGPMALRQPGQLFTAGGLTLIGAVATMILGVAIVAWAGKRKEHEQTAAEPAPARASDGPKEPAASALRTPFAIGLLFCVLSGVLSASVNFGFIYGQPLSAAAARTGTAAWAQGFAIWALVFTGNYAVNVVYAVCLMMKNGTFGVLVRESRPSYWLWALFMGVAWPGGIAVYGMAAGMLGTYGAYVGFPMMLLCSILVGNLAGLWSGEWRGTSARTRRVMQVGVLVLLAALVVLGLANRLLEGT
jgi:L-rhamnose-H+ transport protein